MHAPRQSVSQHFPSTQNPVPHCDASVHGVPPMFLHAPSPLHAKSPLQLVSSSTPPFGTFVHVPRCPVTLHAMHCAVHAVPQQYPSTQKPLVHAPFALHGCPLLSLHAPAPSHDDGVAQVPGSFANCGTLKHVPSCPLTLHAVHVPAHPVSQQYPSTQKPVAHWLFSVHVWPSASLQLPAPSHSDVPTHAPFGTLSVVSAGCGVHVPTCPPTLHA
jgi:hypothetical protein